LQDLCLLIGCQPPITLPQLKLMGFLPSSTPSDFNYDFSKFSFFSFFDIKLPSGRSTKRRKGTTKNDVGASFPLCTSHLGVFPP
jgi:hypothetical protein